jgi:hypothetical protein
VLGMYKAAVTLGPGGDSAGLRVLPA